MPDYRLPKRVNFAPATDPEADPGIATSKDTLKVGLKKCHIEPESWEVRAEDRASWRNLV